MSVGNNQPSPDEIPEALRDATPLPEKKLNRSWLFLGGGLSFVLLAGFMGWYWWDQNSEASIASQVEEVTPPVNTENKPSSSPTEASSSDQTSVTATTASDNDLLGHLPYEETKPENLTPVTRDGRIKLRTEAAKKFVEMQGDARRDGVLLVPLSGFRSVEEQEYLFFEIKAQRGQVTTERAEVSAPPGYSEHHTGYAIDIGDGKAPATHVEQRFEKTEAFAWLEANAPRYSFELSFPKDNPQEVSYEPWHWRYVGNQESLKIFYKNK
ncbi:M15 family metallopeptidase [Dactylococcopsis salina]|uniref:D-alanyl-D-alanine carboxypeptidase n=1 Tax=Dactylococcopsis salina (strain PCC 8305) TaxID=13035 RepID=K9YSJ5_DACS8|nr:M15 family metallopeptidase [Dactylococcopsis salina]AFZ49305.1 D-alanyl-D-alanine carboxypeptidase [Dactylococcopsis salina PCC 8305]